jgi:hypothetical protein
MTVQQGTPESAVLVAIDVSKLRHDVLIAAPGWRSNKRLIVPNRADEFRHFAEYLHSLDRPVHIAFEATGDYHRGLAHFLLGQGFQLHLVSSLALARTREALHNSWDKNDPKDAQVILHMLRSGLVQHYHDPLAQGLNDYQATAGARLDLSGGRVTRDEPCRLRPAQPGHVGEVTAKQAASGARQPRVPVLAQQSLGPTVNRGSRLGFKPNLFGGFKKSCNLFQG